jgi:hypothetical protein
MTTLSGNAAALRSTAWFCGSAAVTGVGSLPFTSAAPAIDLVARYCPEVPFWPQLRRMSPREAMIPQTFGRQLHHLSALKHEHAWGLPSERVDAFLTALERAEARFERSSAAGFFAFTDAFERGRFPSARAVKGQVMGPVTTACSLVVDGTSFADRAELREAVADYLVRLAGWQIDALLKLSSSVVLVFDEAYLGAAARQSPERRQMVADLLKSVILRVRRPAVLIGIHCCDEVPLSLIAEIEPDLYSFDAFHGGEVFGADVDAARFVAAGGHVAWGWVPTLDDLDGTCAQKIVQRWRDATHALAAHSDVGEERIRARSLVTASCGLAGSSVPTCEKSFQIALEVSRRFTEHSAEP